MILFAKRDSHDTEALSLTKRFSDKLSHYLSTNPYPNNELPNEVIDIQACYALCGDTDHQASPDDIDALRQTISALMIAYESRTSHWLEPEQVALALLRFHAEHQAKTLRKQESFGFADENALLTANKHDSILHLALLADALGLKQFQVGHSQADDASDSAACKRTLNVLLDDTCMQEIEAFGRELRDDCKQAMLEQGADAEHLKASWQLRLRYTDADTSLLLKCMPIEMLRDVFEKQHAQRFGPIDGNQAILIEALEVEVRKEPADALDLPTNNPYPNQYLSAWTATETEQGTLWQRNDTKIAKTPWLDCKILQEILSPCVANSTDATVHGYLIKNFEKEVDANPKHP